MNRFRHVVLLLSLFCAGCLPKGYAAAAILRPFRLPRFDANVPEHRDILVEANGIRLRGWLFEPTQLPARGLVVFLHGKDNNRSFGVEVARHFVPLGFAVLAYDQRAHGESTGKFCTYGVRERRDLRAVLDAHPHGRVHVIGHSLGAAVALQAAAEDSRIRSVVAIASFSDLETIVRDRAPGFMDDEERRETIGEAERQARFRFEDASPVVAAQRLRIPVLLVHGEKDEYIAPSHSQRLHAALSSTAAERLLLIPEAGHEDVVTVPAVWTAAVDWVQTPRPFGDAPVVKSTSAQPAQPSAVFKKVRRGPRKRGAVAANRSSKK